MLEGLQASLKIKGCLFDFDGSAGVDTGSIDIESGAHTGLLIEDCRFVGNGDGEECVKIGDANFGDGLILHCYGSVTDITDVIVLSNECSVIESYFSEHGTFNGGSVCNTTANQNSNVPAATSIA